LDLFNPLSTMPFEKTLKQGRNICHGSLSHPHPHPTFIVSSNYYIIFVIDILNIPDDEPLSKVRNDRRVMLRISLSLLILPYYSLLFHI
jgi:hypothetical protein